MNAHKSLPYHESSDSRRFLYDRFWICWVQNPQFLVVGRLSFYPTAPGRFVMLPKGWRWHRQQYESVESRTDGFLTLPALQTKRCNGSGSEVGSGTFCYSESGSGFGSKIKWNDISPHRHSIKLCVSFHLKLMKKIPVLYYFFLLKIICT